MKDEFMNAAKNGSLIKTNTFVTDKGVYAIFIVRHDDALFFYKCKNGKLVECMNLSEAKGGSVDAK